MFRVTFLAFSKAEVTYLAPKHGGLAVGSGYAEVLLLRPLWRRRWEALQGCVFFFGELSSSRFLLGNWGVVSTSFSRIMVVGGTWVSWEMLRLGEGDFCGRGMFLRSLWKNKKLLGRKVVAGPTSVYLSLGTNEIFKGWFVACSFVKLLFILNLISRN